MIRNAANSDRASLADFVAAIINADRSYISHGDIQMGIAIDNEILSENFREKWLEYLDRQMAKPDNIVLILEDEGGIGGFAIAGLDNDGAADFGVIYDIAVAPRNRGKGFGKLLMAAMMEFFKSKGVTSLYLESGIRNGGAHHFFERFGFKKVSYVFRAEL